MKTAFCDVTVKMIKRKHFNFVQRYKKNQI